MIADAELEDVTKVYDDGTRAVDRVSFSVGRGEFFSLLGPSGCGKSTTLRLIAGLERASGGRISVRGEAMGDRPPHRRPTNMVFQRLALFPHMTVADNIAFGLRLKRMPRREAERRVADALELVRLPGQGDRHPHQLSGGQQQRVAIARALVNEPAVLLLDEPLGALDLRLRLELQAALKRIQEESGTTFVYVTHDQTEALTMSDRIGVMNDGRLEQVGTPNDIYRHPATRFAATFVGDTNLLEGRMAGDGTFESGGLRFRVPAAGAVACIRPERMLVGHSIDSSGANVFDGQLEKVVFQGATVRYRIRVAATERVLIADRPSDHVAPFEPGERLQVGWPVAGATMLDG